MTSFDLKMALLNILQMACIQNISTLAIPYRVEQGTCREPPVLKTGSLQCQQVFPVIKAGFPWDNVNTGNTCFHYRDRVCSVSHDNQNVKEIIIGHPTFLIWELTYSNKDILLWIQEGVSFMMPSSQHSGNQTQIMRYLVKVSTLT